MSFDEILTREEEVEVFPLSGGENPGGVADKHPPGGHHVDCENYDDPPINSNEGGEEVSEKSDAEGVGCSEGAELPFQSLPHKYHTNDI